MGERTEGQADAQAVTALDWLAAKARLRHDPPPEGGRHFWAERMRNAWVAYHAGAPWMHPGRSAMLRMAENNARLRTEVERLTRERDGLRVALASGTRLGRVIVDALAREDGAP